MSDDEERYSYIVEVPYRVAQVDTLRAAEDETYRELFVRIGEVVDEWQAEHPDRDWDAFIHAGGDEHTGMTG